LKPKSLLEPLLAFSASAAACSYALFRIAFLGGPSQFLLGELLVVAMSSLLAGISAASLRKAFVIFYSSYAAAVVAATVLVRQPLDVVMGGFAGDLATMVVARNIGFFSLILGLPASVVFLVIGAYVGDRLGWSE